MNALELLLLEIAAGLPTPADHTTGEQPQQAVLPVILEGDLAVVFSQEVQEPLVVARLEVEEARDDLVVSPRFL